MKLSSFLLFILLAFVAGCTHRQQQANAPAPPSIPEPQIEATKPSVPQQTDEAVSGPKVVPAPVIPSRIENERVLYAELGIASWYGSPYHNRRAANGEVYDMNQMTAAHRTLPLNSIVRVTNPQTGNSVIVRITDRGPFIGERMLDLSLAASK